MRNGAGAAGAVRAHSLTPVSFGGLDEDRDPGVSQRAVRETRVPGGP